MSEIIEKAKALLSSRKRAYQLALNFESQDVKAMLSDLAKFCRANDSSFHTDPRVHAVLEGRREVWLRIQKYLNLTPDQLWELYRKE